MQLGGPELVIVLLVAAMVFGPSRVTGLARALGESVHEFRRAQREGEGRPGPD